MRLTSYFLLFSCLILWSRWTKAEPSGTRVEIYLSSNSASVNATYDQLHVAAILDQRDNYLEPVRSLDTRQVRALNGLYDFCFDAQPAGFGASWFNGPLAELCPSGDYYRMPVPSAFNEILTNASARDYMGWMWYQTEFMLPAEGSADARHLIQFDSINYLAIIWAQLVDRYAFYGNDEAKLLGSHVGGHLPIVVDLSELLQSHRRLGALEYVRLTIAVSNLLTPETIPSGQLVDMSELVGRPFHKFQPDFDFFHFAGIMGDVQLVQLAPVHFRRVAVSAAPPEPPESRQAAGVQLDLHLSVSAHELLAENIMLCAYLLGQTETSDTLDLTPLCPPAQNISACNSNHLTHTIRLDGGEQLAAWPLGSRKAKTLRLQLVAPNSSQRGSHSICNRLFWSDKFTILDTYHVKLVARANMTQVMAATAGGQLQGFGMHHEQLFSGRTMSLAAIMKDLYLLRTLRANVLRSSHYPYSRAYLEACDELGIMVIGESPAVGLRSFGAPKLALHKQLLREMMPRDHEHPSIVMWSIANEPQCQLAESRAYFLRLTGFARNQLAEFTVRAGRPLTAAIAQSHADDKLADLLDVVMVNRYFGWYEHAGTLAAVRRELETSLLGWARKYGRQKPLVLSEFGAEAVAGVHSSTGSLHSEEFQRDLIELHEQLFDELAANRSQLNFWGAMIWNFADFSTHESLARVGAANRKGVFSREREPKLAAESVRRIFERRAAS